VAIRSTLTPGTITLTAKRDGLKTGTLEIKSAPVEINAGLSTELPQQLPGPMAQAGAGGGEHTLCKTTQIRCFLSTDQGHDFDWSNL